MNQCLRSLAYCVAFVSLALFSTEAVAKSNKSSAPKKTHAAKGKDSKAAKQRTAASGKGKHAKHAAAKRKVKEAEEKPAAPALTGDLAAVKEAIDLARKGKTEDATAAKAKITDPAGQKLAEWYILRHSEATANFNRYAAFLTATPDWPGQALMRRRAESRLWQEKSSAATIHKFTADRPHTARGKLALARVLLAEGDRDRAARFARDTWRADELTERTESDAYEAFRDLLTADDHRARMDKRLGDKDLWQRAARRASILARASSPS